MIEPKKRTDFLFVKRGFWSGFSSVLDIFAEGKKFNSSKDGNEADSKALQNDWEMVGQDIRKSLKELSFD
jgi:hypothetical protein